VRKAPTRTPAYLRRVFGERGPVFSSLVQQLRPPLRDWLHAAPYIRPHGRGEGATGRGGTAHGKRNQRKEGQRKKIGQICYSVIELHKSGRCVCIQSLVPEITNEMRRKGDVRKTRPVHHLSVPRSSASSIAHQDLWIHSTPKYDPRELYLQ
jgi:hypothetical protein